ncbi:MAG: 50S ribosomal protein L25 [Acidobacteriota bacterium]
MSELTIEVQNREETGKNKNRQLRTEGRIPAVVYGGELDPANIQVAERTIAKLLRNAGENAVFLLSLEGTDQTRHAMIKELDVDPVSGQVLHIDFQRVNMSEKIRLQVPVELVGEPLGVRMEGGMIDFVNREVEVECLPGNIPETVTVNVEELHVGQHAEAKDLELGEGVELIDDPERVIASITAARIAETVSEDEDEEAAEGAEAAPEAAEGTED